MVTCVGNMVWYVVHVGRVPGIYRTWRDCHAQVHRYRGNCYKKYNTEAEAFAAYHGANIPNNNDQDLAMEIEEMPALQIEEMPAGNMTFLGRLLLGLRRMLCFN